MTLNEQEIGTLLDNLRAEVRARRLSQAARADDSLRRDLQRALDEIELHRVISAHWPLIGRTLPQRLIALINKLVRRYLRWYINPIVEQQNAYNDAVARTLRLLAEAYDDLASGDVAPPITQITPQPTSDNRQATTNDIQAQVQTNALAEPPVRFPDLQLQAQEPLLQLRQRVSAHWPLPVRTLPERGVALVNKSVRQYLRWYINPIVDQQNSANTAVTTTLHTFVRLDAQRRAENAKRRALVRGLIGGQLGSDPLIPDP